MESNSQEEVARSRRFFHTVHFEDEFESSQETNNNLVNDQSFEVPIENRLNISIIQQNNYIEFPARKTNNRSQKTLTTPTKSYTPRKSNTPRKPTTPRKTSTPRKTTTPRKPTTPRKTSTPRKSVTPVKSRVPSHLLSYLHLTSEDENAHPVSFQQFKANTPKKQPQKQVINISSTDVSDQDGPLNSTRTRTPRKKVFSVRRDPPEIINISSTSSPSSSSPSPSPPRTQQRTSLKNVSSTSNSKTFGFNSSSDSDTRKHTSVVLAKNSNTVNSKALEVDPVHHDPSTLVNYSQNYHETRKTLEEADSESEKFNMFAHSQNQNFERILSLSNSFSQNCSIPTSCPSTVCSPLSPLRNDSPIKVSTSKSFSSSVCDASQPQFFSVPAKLYTTNFNDSDTENMGSAETIYPDIVVASAVESNKPNSPTTSVNMIQSMDCDDNERTSPEISFGFDDRTNFIIDSQVKTPKQPSMTDYFQIKKKLMKKSRRVKNLKKKVKKLEKKLDFHERAARQTEVLRNPLMKELLKEFNHADHLKDQEKRNAERLLKKAVICPTGECRCFCPPNWLGCVCLCFCP